MSSARIGVATLECLLVPPFNSSQSSNHYSPRSTYCRRSHFRPSATSTIEPPPSSIPPTLSPVHTHSLFGHSTWRVMCNRQVNRTFISVNQVDGPILMHSSCPLLPTPINNFSPFLNAHLQECCKPFTRSIINWRAFSVSVRPTMLASLATS